jgi:hypothetical protein
MPLNGKLRVSFAWNGLTFGAAVGLHGANDFIAGGELDVEHMRASAAL